MTERTMHLSIHLPTRVLAELQVEKIVAEGAHGCFCILPRHCDTVAALVPGLFAYVPSPAPGTADRPQRYLAMDRGLLVKCGDDVRVSVRGATSAACREGATPDDAGPDAWLGPGDGLDALPTLARVVREDYASEHQQEATARSALARLEAGFVRRLHELAARAGGGP